MLRPAPDGPGLPRDLRRLMEPRPSGADYCFVELSAGTLGLLLRHPRPFAVVESMRASGRISDDLAETLANAIKQGVRAACGNPSRSGKCHD